jgi:hypothetical protein
MSLAIYAAPFNENDDYKNNDNVIHKKKQTHNKTQKRLDRENFDTEKVNSVLQTIHQNSKVEEDGNTLGEFNPPPNPESSGVQKTIATEQMMNMTNLKTLGQSPQPHYEYNPENDLDLNNFQKNYGDQTQIEEYYKKFIPNYQAQKRHNVNRPYYPQSQSLIDTTANNNNMNNDLFMQKLNYMINLLEEQQDERTNHVTEEVVLYSFLGIFIIFVVDSFARVGKYVR